MKYVDINRPIAADPDGISSRSVQGFPLVQYVLLLLCVFATNSLAKTIYTLYFYGYI